VLVDHRNIHSGSPYEEEIGFSRAVRATGRVLVSGTAPAWPDGSCYPDCFRSDYLSVPPSLS
jgi:hypothetical protein